MAEGYLAQRWVIFEAVPMAGAIPFLGRLSEEHLEDPVLRWAWNHALEHEEYPIPFWVCQGPPQGHPVSYNPVEKLQARMGQLPELPPPIGVLPYQEPNQRTFEAIAHRSVINRRFVNTRSEWDARIQEMQRKSRQQLMDTVDETLGDVLDEARSEILQNSRTVERTDYDPANVQQDDLDAYVETGNFTY